MIGSDSSCSASDPANQKLGYCLMRAHDKKNRPALKDSAREAQLSASTVSLALRDPQTNRVSSANRKKIMAIAKRLNF